MANLTQNLILQRVPDVRVHIDSSNKIGVLLDGRFFYFGPHGLAILDAFYRPASVSEVLRELSMKTTGAQDWVALTSTIMQLYEAGVLQEAETQRKPKLEIGKRSFGASHIHVRMLNDRARTTGFLTSIDEVVAPGDIVVDIGTGTGVLAIAAARAGAEHVYAIESSAIGEVAKAVFEANGLAERITLLKGWSTQIDLPERADVLISEIIGSEPLDENILEVTADALKRLLKPGARTIPSRVRIFGLPVVVPRAELTNRQVLTTDVLQDYLQSWRSWYGINFDPLVQTIRDSSPAFFIEPQKANSWKALSKPVLMAEIDLREIELQTIDNSITVTANDSGRLNGLLIYFDLELGPTTSLSTHPDRAEQDCNWHSMVWILDPLPLRIEDRFNLTYQYPATTTSHRIAVARA